MQPEHLLTAVTLYAIVWAIGAVVAACHRMRWAWMQLGYAAAGIAAIGVAVWLNSVTSIGRNSLMFIVGALSDGDLRHLSAAALGGCLGLAAALWPWLIAEHVGPRLKQLAHFGVVACSILTFALLSLTTAQDQVEPFLKRRSLGSIVANPFGFRQPNDFSMEEHHDCSFFPVQLAVAPDGAIYVTGYRGAAYQHGIVVRIAEDPQTGAVTETQVAQGICRPHGLAFHNGDLYVSRSGQYSRTEGGRLVGVDTGAVTRMRDLDGDHIMDYFEDVVSGLPGAQGPDPLHQNNGITFGPDGMLYVTVGAHSDRAPATGKYEGTIVRAHPDGSRIEVFASGLRNPFDVCFGPRGELYCTDNDASDRRNGDELNRVVEGAHYGFPYADGRVEHPEGAVSPLLITRDGTFQGLAYTDSQALAKAHRDALYIAGYGNGEIVQVKIGEDGKARSTSFASVPGALDITIADDGVFYVSCYATKKIYRLRQKSSP